MIDLKFENQAPELFQKLEAAVARFIKAGAGQTADHARRSMRSAPRPSRPGGPPAVGSGEYLASIAVVQQSSLEAKVGASVEYAPIFEYELNRPLWGKTLVEVLPTMDEMLKREIAAI